jgi:predicted phage terminase large subunit-like protein
MRDSSEVKTCLYHNRTVILLAKGWASGIRGTNILNKRPDLIFCDDVQTRLNDSSPSDRQKLLSELMGSIFMAVPLTGVRRIIYVGNMYSDECILAKLKRNSHWVSMITGAILADGTALWPAIYSVPSLMESYYHSDEMGEAAIWFAEIMNDPKSIAKDLLPNPIPPCELIRITDHDGAFITADPAGFRKDSDDNVVAVHYKFNNKIYTVESSKGIYNPEEMVKEILRLSIKHQVCLIGIEDTGYQQSLGFWVGKYIRELGLNSLAVVPLSHHGRSKEARIRQYVQELYADNVVILDSATRRDFTWQAMHYKLGQKDNRDDLLDAIAYCLDIRNDYWHLIENIGSRELSSSFQTVEHYNTPF